MNSTHEQDDATPEARAADSLGTLRAVIEATPDAVFVKDLEGRYLLANAACARFVGRPAEEIVGLRDEELYPEETARQFVADDREVIESGETRVFEGAAGGAGGVRQLYRVTKGIVRDERGYVRGVFGISHDMTDRRRAEEERLARVREQAAREASEASGRAKDELLDALKESEERYRSLLENANDIIYSHDLAGNYLTINRAGAEITGYTREEILGGLNIARVVAPEHLELARRMTEQKLAGGGPTVYEVDINTRDGRRLTLEVSTRVSYRDGRPCAVEGIARDVTERKRAEAERTRLAAIVDSQRRRLDNLISSVPGVVWEAWGQPDAASQQINFVSEYVERMLGYTVAEWLSTPNFWLTIVHPEDREEAAAAAAAHFAEGGPGVNRFRWLTKDGRVLWVESHSNVIQDAEGRPVGMRGVVLDMSESRRLQQEREELLEREQEARLRAEEANRVKDEFLATLSHELRTPLTAILGWAKMLSERALDPETTARAVGIIHRNAFNQKQLIDDILDVSRIITGKLRVEPEPFEALSVVGAAVDAVRQAAAARNIQLRCNFDPRAGSVVGDPHRVQQIVWNLLSNAVKFTPDGGSVRVDVERLPAHLRITVSDTGQGIAPDFLPFVFDRFRQGDQTTTRRHGGLGIGLSLVRHLVELHGGSVHAYSAGEGQGATFTVDLPLPLDARLPHPSAGGDEPSACAREEAPSASSAAAGRSMGMPPALVGVRVLVVEDEEDTLELLSMLLRRNGAQVTGVTSARDALDALDAAPFDVLVSDIGMPGEDGYELMRKLRARPAERGGRTPAVALTAYAGDKDRLLALRSGFHLHLSKPVEIAALISGVADLAARGQSVDAE
ncbi:MAG TPA: PAS domain S-box protein [Pyrinomonadaceae bacterium]|nr:PAS domain S-box protein [Pyrinomonadaceae bacterium]